MILKRTTLTAPDKRDFLIKSIRCQAHGDISSLAGEFNVSRKTFYQARNKVEQALQTLIAPPEQADCLTTVEVDKRQLRRAIVALGISAPNSIRAIVDQIPLLYPGCRVSFGYVQGVLVQAQQAAAEFNRRVPLAPIHHVAVDEMFSQEDPVLAGVCLDSGYLFALSHEIHRCAQTWNRVFQTGKQQGLSPKVVVKDGARGIASGVKQAFPQAQQRDDIFHAVYIAGKAVRKTESRAYHAIAREEQAFKAWNIAGTDDTEALKNHIKAEKQCVNAIRYYEHAHKALCLLHDAFSSLCRISGQLMTPQMAQERLKQAITRLRQARHKACKQAAGYLDNRLAGLTYASEALEQALQPLTEQHGLAPVSLACRFWEASRDYHKAPKWKRPSLDTERLGSLNLLQQQLADEPLETLMKQVQTLLSKRHRASSAIEGFNAQLRCYLYVRKGVNQGFLDLFQAWHNLRERRWGNRKGTSAYEMLTGEKVQDWLSMLGFPPSLIAH